MFCIYCGKEIADDSLFCEHCGANLESNTRPATAGGTAPVSAPKAVQDTPSDRPDSKDSAAPASVPQPAQGGPQEQQPVSDSAQPGQKVREKLTAQEIGILISCGLFIIWLVTTAIRYWYIVLLFLVVIGFFLWLICRPSKGKKQ